MNINTSSWHYRYNVWRTTEWKTKSKNTLCSYFWFTIFNLFVAVLVGAFAIAVLFLGGDLINAVVYKWFSVNCDTFPYYSGYLVYIVYGVIFWGITILGSIGIAFLVVSVSELKQWVCNKMNSTPKKNDGLILSWVKAKKNKLCPLINFVEK